MNRERNLVSDQKRQTALIQRPARGDLDAFTRLVREHTGCGRRLRRVPVG